MSSTESRDAARRHSRALVFVGVLLGAGYASLVWLFAEHQRLGHPSGWNMLLLPIILGGVGLLVLFVWTLIDALIGGFDERTR